MGLGELGAPGSQSNPFSDIDTSEWQQYYENPENITACPNPDHCQSMLDLLGSAPDIDVNAYRDSLGDYLNRSDPLSVVGSALGVDSYCVPATGEVVQDVLTVEPYSCHSSYETEDVSTNCDIPLQVDVDQDYQYSCNVPNSDICFGDRLGGHYFRVSYLIPYEGEDPYIDENTPYDVLYQPVFYQVPGCVVLNIEAQNANLHVVEYRCDNALVSFDTTGEINTVNEQADCTSSECDALDQDPQCSPAGDETCEGGPATSVENVTCVPDGQSVDGVECQRDLAHELEVYFSYECNYIYDEVSGELSPDPKCVDLINDPSCLRTGEECVQQADHELEDIVCEVGDVLTYHDESCMAQRYGLGYQEFLYVGTETFNVPTTSFVPDQASTLITANSSCRSHEQSCILEAPETVEYEVCREGFEEVDTSYNCLVNRDITVDEDYIYGTRRTFDPATGDHPPADSFKAGLEAEASCVSQGETCELVTPPQYEEHVCLQGYRLNLSQESCLMDREITVDTDYGYVGLETYYEDVPGADGSVLFVPDAQFTNASNASCSVLSRECTTPRPPSFETQTCQEGWDYHPQEVVLTRPRIVEVDTDYFYTGYNDYVEGSGFVKDSALNTLESVATCNLQSNVCALESGGVFSTHECRVGYSETFSDHQCEVPLVVSTDTDYIYQASEYWNSTGFLASSELVSLRNASVCSMQNRSCVTDSPGVFEDYSCESGYIRTYNNQTFRREPEIHYDYDYYYNGQRSWNGSTHAHNSLGTALAADNSCNLQSSVCSTVTPPPFNVYTCRQGYEDVTSAMSCARDKLITVDLDYTYTVDRTWNTSSNSWTGTSDWNAVRGSVGQAAQCVKQSGTCTAQSPGVYSEHSCQQGYTIDPQAMSCQRTLSFTVETDYRYVGYENWNGSGFTKDATLTNVSAQAGSKSCVRESVVNQLPATTAEKTSYFECFQGNVSYDSQLTCSAQLNVTVTSTPAYIYEVADFMPGFDILSSAPDCTLTGGFNAGGWPEPYFIFEFTCNNTHSGVGIQYQGQTSNLTVSGESVDQSACNAAISQNLPLNSEVCTDGPSTKTINGLSVYRTCWAWDRVYGSTTTEAVNTCSVPSGYSLQSDVAYNGSPLLGTSRTIRKKTYKKVEPVSNLPNKKDAYSCFTGYWRTQSGQQYNYSCSPPGGSSLVSQDCAWTDSGGVCRLYARSYNKTNPGPTGGYKRHQETWLCDLQVTGSGVASPSLVKTRKDWIWENDQCPSAIAGFSHGCSLSSQSYVGASVPKTIDGLTITRQWQYQSNYTCQQIHHVDTCTPLLASLETGPANTQFAQNEIKSFKGDPTIELAFERDLKSSGRGAQSPPYVKYASLEIEAIPDQLKSVERAPVMKDWIDVPSDLFNTGIDEPPIIQYAAVGDWTPDGQTCLNYEGGTCTLWKKDYLREESDPSGGCHTEQEVWFCENAVSAAGTPSISRHITSETWQWPSPDCTAKFAQYDSCVLQNEVADTSTGGTRVINGLSINRSAWELKRNYSCTKRHFTNTCSPPANASVENVSCVWSDSSGICRLSDYVYHEPLPDPSGGCTTFTDTYLCENRNHGAEIDTLKKFVNMTFPRSSAHQAVHNTPSCPLISSLWGGGTAPQNIGGVSVYPGTGQQWYLDETYRCYSDETVNTCNVPANSTLVSQSCQATIDGGACSLTRHNYSVELPDPSGGCHEWQEEFLCSDPVNNAGSPVGTPTIETGDSENTAACQSLESNSACAYQGKVCIEGAGTRTINGISVYKSCWKYDYNYECTQTHHVNSCSPAATATLESETCAYTDRGGVCRLFDRVYINEEHDPSGGCHREEHTYLCENAVAGLSHFDTQKSIEEEFWDPAPFHTMQGNFYTCEYIQGSYHTSTPEVRVVDGLSINRAWDGYWTYDCANRDAVNTCNMPSGSTLENTVCAESYRGNCVLDEHTYSVPVLDQAGGCSVYSTNFKCEDPLAGGTTYTEWKTITSEVFNGAACNALVNGFETCRQTAINCVEGPETRNIDGLDVTRDCWKREIEYDCDTLERFDTCTVPPEALNVETNCVWTDSGGTCRLFENIYDVELPDPTNGCTTFIEKYRCEEPYSGPDLIEIARHVEGDIWESSDCDREEDGSICTQSSSCVAGEETRLINGLEVTRSCWQQERANSCLRTDTYAECAQYANLGTPEESCLWSDDQGICRLFEKTYERPVDDGSGGCHTWENSYWCGAQISELTPERDHIEVTSTLLDYEQCSGIAQTEGALLLNTACDDPATSPRAPPSVRHRETDVLLTIGPNTTVSEVDESCWREERTFSIESRESVNECVGQISNLCVLNSTKCTGTRERNGACALETFDYTCGIEGTDYCEVQENSFSCVGPAVASGAQLSNLNGNLAGYQPSEISAEVIRTYWEDSQCASAISFGTCLLVDTICEDSGAGGPRPVQQAQDDYFQQFIGYAPPQLEGCWKQRRVYDCGPPSNIDYCGSDANGCELSGTDCLVTDDSGNCLMDVNLYACTSNEPGTCSGSSQDYICDNPVDGMETSGDLEPQVSSEYDLSACESVEAVNENCLAPEVVCTDSEPVRHYEPTPYPYEWSENWALEPTETSFAVESECWNYERTYNCSELGDYSSDCEVPDDCDNIGDVCIGHDPSGNCLTTEHNYSCTRTETEVLAQGTPGTCEPDEATVANSPSGGPNMNISALASLVGMAQADRETGNSDVTIFDGTDKRCGRTVLGVKNCCKDSGVLLSLGLGTCSSDEVELAVQKEENRCHYVGSYCSKKAFFGTCLKKKQTYCCFEAEIGKVISEAGRQQTSKSWGSPKNPDCSGFTVDEFQQLNLDNVDWSSVTADIMQDLDIGDTTSLQNQLTNSINNMIGGGGG
ncbi:MAG: conjugal transfer protein TraN [Maricaulaceae bacterium]